MIDRICDGIFPILMLIATIGIISYVVINSNKSREFYALDVNKWECTKYDKTLIMLNGQPRYVNNCAEYSRK